VRTMGAGAYAVIVFVALLFLEDEEALPLPAGGLPRLLPPTALPTVAWQLPATEVPGRSPAMRERQIAQNWNGSGVLVTIEAAQRTWLLVMGDDEEVFVGMLRPGEYVEAAARFEVLLRAGNAEALLITWNGQEQGIPGLRGQLVEMTFTQTSVAIETAAGFEPTSEFTATAPATSTLEVSALLGTTTPESTPDRLPGPVLRSPPTITRTSAPGAPVTATMTSTARATATPTVTLTATAARTATAIVSPSATAVLPPRVTLPPLTPAKVRRDG